MRPSGDTRTPFSRPLIGESSGAEDRHEAGTARPVLISPTNRSVSSASARDRTVRAPVIRSSRGRPGVGIVVPRRRVVAVFGEIGDVQPLDPPVEPGPGNLQ